VFARVRDVMTQDVITVKPDATMLDAGRLMRVHDIRALPVVEDGIVRGLLNVATLAELYIEEIDVRGFSEMPVTVGHLAHVLDGEVLVGDESMKLAGSVLIAAMEPETMAARIHAGDTLILGDRRRTQPMALDAGVACLVVTGGFTPKADVLESARRLGSAVVVTPHDTFATARLVNLSHTVEGVMDTSMLLVEPDALLSEVVEDLVDSPHREAVVVDADGRLMGILTRTNLARGLRRRVILVDHNEVAQSAPGIEEASVLEIVDHHRVGDVQTTSPILFLGLPVGSTATIVAERYRQLDIEVPEAMAGLLLAAVLSDTVLLKSPTTTALDHAVVERLAGRTGVDPVEFGMEMFSARSRAACLGRGDSG